MIQIDEIPHSFCHLSPHTFICEYRFLALLVEFPDPVFLDVLLAAHVQLLFHLDLHRKSVSVPSGLTLYSKALHGLVTTYRILQGPGYHMMYSRSSVSRRRSLVEYERRVSFPGADTLFQQAFFFPTFGLLHLE